MPRPPRERLLRLPLPGWSGWALLTAAAVLGACGNPPDDSPQRRTEERLVGTWLREYQDQNTTVRRVLVLEADGHFRELATATDADAAVSEHAHAGEWRFDGTNLKRRYTQLDGKQPSAPMVPFATFELRFPSPNEFVGVDNVHRREVRYRRVVEGTVP